MLSAKDIEVKWHPIGRACIWMALAYGAAFLVLALLDQIPEFKLIAENSPWLPKYIGDTLAFTVSMILIWRVSQGRLRDFGFVFTGRDLKVVLSIALGVVLALVGLLLDYLPKVMAGNYDTGPAYPLTLANVLGMMSFQWVFVGIFEEHEFMTSPTDYPALSGQEKRTFQPVQPSASSGNALRANPKNGATPTVSNK